MPQEKFISYQTSTSAPTNWGVVAGDGIVSGSHLCGQKYDDLKSVIAADMLGVAARQAAARTPDLSLKDVIFLPPVPTPSHFFCAGLNYAAHARETGNAAPAAPRFFSRANSSLIGHNTPIIRPKVSTELDYEGELVLIIGKPGRHIKPKDALTHIAGYTCFMDGSLRDWQKHSITAGKNFHATGALGPWMVPATVLTDPTSLTLITRVNGVEVQRATTDLLIHTIPAILAYLSSITPLLPGDCIATGTPEGIGCRRDPPLWLKAGDDVEVEISQIGILANPVANET
ncbi:MAG: fumarylacetoacetate hydrolase family protein [Rhodobacteraceae bacterium]|nr:fumarylacetoacetate hydrolase family protein [Paracoccaceae bacterium]PHR55913.1 MAG: 5-carboxymethyl-2-hydroxymuconate isomerase [Robiginitomaculum sp.]